MHMNIELLLFCVFCLLVCAVFMFIRIWLRRRSLNDTREIYEKYQRKRNAVPVTLHPVFDRARCIGSGSCTRVCPQGDAVIGLVHGRGALVDPTLCIGHGRCAAECPTGAIRLVFGTAERGAAIPELTPRFESNVEGLYITGELGGMGLVTNAVRQAAEAVDNIAESLKEAPMSTTEEVLDLAIVGAGPAGMTGALRALDHRLNYRLFDRETTFGGAIAHYPRHKIVVLRETRVPRADRLRSGEMTKSELIAFWEKALARNGVRPELGVLIDRVVCDEEKGLFTLFDTEDRPVARARRVMLCVGRRGTPRRLGVPGEDLPHVVYGLAEADRFSGRRVLVVGAGEVAVETVCSLAEESDAEITVVIRRELLESNNAFNQKRLDAVLATGRLKLMARSAVAAIAPDTVTLEKDGARLVVDADDIIVNIGGEPPTALLKKSGVTMKLHHGEEIRPSSPRVSYIFESIQNPHRHAPKPVNPGTHTPYSPRPILLLAAVLASLLLAIVIAGHHHYLFLPGADLDHLQARLFEPSGVAGHAIGIMAAVMILFNLAYLIRKELRPLQQAGNLRTWLGLHMVLGLTAGTTTLLHTTFAANNVFAATLYGSVGVVLLTGMIGRYLYAFIPVDPRGRALAHSTLVSLSERMEARFGELFADVAGKTAIQKTLDREFQPSSSALLLLARALFNWPRRYLSLWRTVRRARAGLSADAYRDFRIYAFNMLALRVQLEAFPPLRKLFGTWRGMHGLFAVLMIFLIATHVVIEVWVGYRWIF